MASKNSSRVGAILYSLYESVDRGNRAAFKKFLSRAPSGCEIVANYKNVSIETVQAILSAIQSAGLPGPGVIGAQGFKDGFTIYIKGDFPEDAFTALTEMFMQSGAEVASGRFDANQMKELP